MTQVRDAGIQSSLEGDSSFPDNPSKLFKTSMKDYCRYVVFISILYRLDGTRLVTGVVGRRHI